MAIKLEINEIKRYLKLKSLIGVDSSDYSKDMDNLINYLNDIFIYTKSFKIKKTEYFGNDIDHIIFYLYCDNISIDMSILEYMLINFLLSIESIYEIVEYWLLKIIKINDLTFNFKHNITRDTYNLLND